MTATFVSTLGGVVSFDIQGQSGGAQISGGNEGDRFIMGLLRASADAVLVGGGIVNAVSSMHLWIAEFAYPMATDAYAYYRQEVLKKPHHPLIVIVSGRGHLDLSRSVFHTSGIKVLIVTSELGRDRLLRGGADRLPSTQIRQLPAVDGNVDPHTITGAPLVCPVTANLPVLAVGGQLLPPVFASPPLLAQRLAANRLSWLIFR